ncbi:PGAP1-domain-containing protein [Gloeophyllum trabeum ATCC 11539]|uniref:GPI inositol-deacylase n=1 Tax=Gloeophyllum trabeum (strain ATCC 11539 / FP-39264 / Madison 617) TaxID=670483 RepID=S7QIP5_GLOTA|nr:PGAP1-domain-containing protein [Gloeophyllum trabeum ATCC 11539]EPQ59202.1 PGAP1-domain-containing protein [Gloeophyllum trabeum ATCC 11539]
MTRLASFLGLVSVLLIWVSYKAASETASVLSPQGCRMSWMSPSYVLQDEFDKRWTRLSKRYSLWLYREVGWDSHELQGSPVLFIPGNAGSSRQVRSIASSATRQYFSSPSVPSPEFANTNVKPLDFFALEFNEDLSAFHGPTLTAQTSYARAAISYILSLYPENTTVTVLGHSMGGIVSTSLLPDARISSVITMSTPHTLPPARFDRRIDDIYEKISVVLGKDWTPILSLCGGAIDMQIPSESCILPKAESDEIYRRTVFTTALEGAWTGVGHLAMVWCHQVRWRVARAALELAALASPSPGDKSRVLDQWLPGGDGRTLLPTDEKDMLVLGERQTYEALPENMKLVLKNPTGSHMYLLPVPSSQSGNPTTFMLYLSGGNMHPYDKHVQHLQSRLRVSVHLCSPSADVIPERRCKPLQPATLKLIPNPTLTQPFPSPDEGTDESEGVVMFSADIPETHEGQVAVRLEEAAGTGWIVAAIEERSTIVNTAGWIVSVTIRNNPALAQEISFPNFLSNALVVYRVNHHFVTDQSTCSSALLPPLLLHTSSAVEASYHPLSLPPSSHQTLLHTHASAPYISTFVPSSDLDSDAATSHGLHLKLLTSNEQSSCKVDAIALRVDWWATLGRWAARYWTACIIWSVGIASILLFEAIKQGEECESVATPILNLHACIKGVLPILLPLLFLTALLPHPTAWYLGLGWHGFGLGLIGGCIASILVITCSGLVAVTCFILYCSIAAMRRLTRIFGRPREDISVRRNTVLSMALICVLVFFFVPWQVAFLGNWLILLWTCAMKSATDNNPSSPRVEAVPLMRMSGNADNDNSSPSPMRQDTIPPRSSSHQAPSNPASSRNFYLHLLLMKTLLLPLVAPVLAVWVRTLYTAGLTTPFDGDHNFLSVLPWLILVDYASWTRGGELLGRGPYEGLSMRWLFLVLASAAFLVGPRGTYRVFEVATISMTSLVGFRIGPRYWGSEFGHLNPRL